MAKVKAKVRGMTLDGSHTVILPLWVLAGLSSGFECGGICSFLSGLLDYLLLVPRLAPLLTLVCWLALLMRLWHLLMWLLKADPPGLPPPHPRLRFKAEIQAQAPLQPSTSLSEFFQMPFCGDQTGFALVKQFQPGDRTRKLGVLLNRVSHPVCQVLPQWP